MCLWLAPALQPVLVCFAPATHQRDASLVPARHSHKQALAANSSQWIRVKHYHDWGSEGDTPSDSDDASAGADASAAAAGSDTPRDEL